MIRKPQLYNALNPRIDLASSLAAGNRRQAASATADKARLAGDLSLSGVRRNRRFHRCHRRGRLSRLGRSLAGAFGDLACKDALFFAALAGVMAMPIALRPGAGALPVFARAFAMAVFSRAAFSSSRIKTRAALIAPAPPRYATRMPGGVDLWFRNLIGGCEERLGQDLRAARRAGRAAHFRHVVIPWTD